MTVTSTSTPRPLGRAVAVANPASGGAVDDDALRDACAGAGVEVVPTTEDDPGTGQAARAVSDGASTVVACGGDGTVRAVMEGVAGSSATLGVVPLGTGNLLAANLGLPSGLDALHTAVNGPIRRIDVGEVNGERFAVMAGMGFDALLIRDASSTVKRRFGSIAYVFSAIRNLPARLFTASVTVDGRVVHRGRTAMVLIGNCGSVTGGLEVFPDARPDDGILDVAVLSASRFREWCSVGWRLVRGRAQRPELVHRATGTDIVVTTVRATPWELDGEDRPPETSLRFTIQPDALAVHVAGDEETGS